MPSASRSLRSRGSGGGARLGQIAAALEGYEGYEAVIRHRLDEAMRPPPEDEGV